MSDHSAIDEQVRQLVRSHRPELERLVDQALERELAQLVEQRLAARANGNGNEAAPRAETRVCVSCGRERPIDKFEHGRRRVCTTCRSRAHQARVREREHQPDVEPDPRPAAIAVDELLRRARVHGTIAPDLTAWLVEQELALDVDGLLAPTPRALELGAELAP